MDVPKSSSVSPKKYRHENITYGCNNLKNNLERKPHHSFPLLSRVSHGRIAPPALWDVARAQQCQGTGKAAPVLRSMVQDCCHDDHPGPPLHPPEACRLQTSWCLYRNSNWGLDPELQASACSLVPHRSFCLGSCSSSSRHPCSELGQPGSPDL